MPATKTRPNNMSKRRFANEEILRKAKESGPMPPEEAAKVLKSFKGPRFDQTVEVCVHLGIDPRQADQQLRGSIAMPHGTGKTARVVAFCPDDQVDASKQAGAIEAGNEELVKKIEGGWMEFDVAVATPDQMRTIGKLGRVLGPKGLMPSPKAGTVTNDVPTAVQEFSAGKTSYRNDDHGNVHCIIGKISFSEDALAENLRYFLDTIKKIKPASSKGTYIKKCVISGTMTPSIPIAVP